MWIQMKKHCPHEWYDGAAVSGSCSSGMNQYQGIYLGRQESKRVRGRRSWPRSWSTETANSGAGDLLVKWRRDQLSFDLYSWQSSTWWAVRRAHLHHVVLDVEHIPTVTITYHFSSAPTSFKTRLLICFIIPFINPFRWTYCSQFDCKHPGSWERRIPTCRAGSTIFEYFKITL